MHLCTRRLNRSPPDTHLSQVGSGSCSQGSQGKEEVTPGCALNPALDGGVHDCSRAQTHTHTHTHTHARTHVHAHTFSIRVNCFGGTMQRRHHKAGPTNQHRGHGTRPLALQSVHLSAFFRGSSPKRCTRPLLLPWHHPQMTYPVFPHAAHGSRDRVCSAVHRGEKWWTR